MFFQRRNETIIPAAQISKREKLLFFRPGPASSSSSCLQGTERVEVKQSALCHCSCSGRLRTGRVALVGYRTAVCRYDGLRSEARGPAAGGGSAADCGRHHHRAALHNGSQLGKEDFKVRTEESGTRGGFYAWPCFAHSEAGAKLMQPRFTSFCC